MSLLRDDDDDEDLYRFLDNLAISLIRTVPLTIGNCCIDMLGHINEGENEQETILRSISH